MNPSRSIFELTGEDRLSFLQGLLTQDVSQIAAQKIQFTALLSPQGKILNDMFLLDRGESIFIDTPTLHAEALRKRLMMYKLRAKVALQDVSSVWRAISVAPNTPEALPDPRHADLPWRLYTTDASKAEAVSQSAVPVPDSATDFAPDEITAMDAGYDLLHAISFTKGCYVGQEIIARMHYKAIARKGFFTVSGAALQAPGAVVMQGKTIGDIRYVEHGSGLALLRFEDALSGAPVTVDNQPVTITAPGWLQPKIDAFRRAEKP